MVAADEEGALRFWWMLLKLLLLLLLLLVLKGEVAAAGSVGMRWLRVSKLFVAGVSVGDKTRRR